MLLHAGSIKQSQPPIVIGRSNRKGDGISLQNLRQKSLSFLIFAEAGP